jgi:hypothetical protein
MSRASPPLAALHAARRDRAKEFVMTATALFAASTAHLLTLLAGWLTCAALIVGLFLVNRRRIKALDDGDR